MTKINNSISRRKFIRNTSIGLGGAFVAPTILTNCTKGANDKILIAHIGVGSRGQQELKDYFLPNTSSYSLAMCDPRKEWREVSAKYSNKYYEANKRKAPLCEAYLNFEEVLERPDIDAVSIATPDHWHVPLAIKAARAGKHIMLAKPLGLSYPNYKILEKELKENDVRFHYGTQQRSMQHMQMGIQMIKEGLIGEVERVEVWAPGKNPVQSPVCNEVPVPEGFDYDLWTGPAPLNSYCPDRVTNNSSWFQWDYSIGFLAGWGAHPLDVMVWAIKDQVNGVYHCEGTGKFWEPGGMYNNIISWDLNYQHNAGLQVRFVSSDVAEKTDMLNYRINKESNGTTFFGTKGWLSLSRGSAQSNIPEVNLKLENILSTLGTGKWGLLTDENNMGKLFVDVVKGKIKETCPLDEAIISDCISHMGNIAIRTSQKITWNPEIGQVENNPTANNWFIRDMRAPYTV